ncbi:MAG: hypothetical protein ACE5I2_11265 [Anaerolineae bacterium]
MKPGTYNIVEQFGSYSPYPTTLSIIEFLRLAWREEPPPAREITVTGLDTLLASISHDEQAQAARFIRDTLQDVANLMANRRQTVQFVVRGKIDRGQFFEVRQPTGQYVNLSAVFGTRLRQEANDWLVAPLWI